MSNRLLIDNWTLQSVGELLNGGLSGDTASELVVDSDRTGFSFQDVSRDVINVIALFQSLFNLVLIEEILVDDASIASWQKFDSEFHPVVSRQLIVPKPFKAIQEKWVPTRERYAEELCVCKSMRDLHMRNVDQWQKNGETENAYFSQLIWGGAGMLARANAFEIPYTTHPLRESWFRQVDTLFGQQSATERVQEFVKEQRIKVLKRIETGGYLASLNLPAIATRIVQEANTSSDLMRIALQFRDEYTPLRKWLGQFQQALDSEDTKDALQYERLLQSVSRQIEAQCSAFPVGDTNMQIGLSWIKGTVKTGSPLNAIRNKFGVRAMLNKLIMGSTGKSVLARLCRLFGEEHTKIGVSLQRSYFAHQSRETNV